MKQLLITSLLVGTMLLSLHASLANHEVFIAQIKKSFARDNIKIEIELETPNAELKNYLTPDKPESMLTRHPCLPLHFHAPYPSRPDNPYHKCV